MGVKTSDGVFVEVTHSDAGFPPGKAEPGQSLNTTCVWYKPDGHNWQRSGHRSAMKVCDVIKRSELKELAEKMQ